MLSRSNLLMLAALGLGSLLGYAAASGYLNPFPRAAAQQPATAPAVCPEEVGAKGDCCQGLSKKDGLTLVSHNTAVRARAQKEGKKPNIVVIMGDDIGWF